MEDGFRCVRLCSRFNMFEGQNHCAAVGSRDRGAASVFFRRVNTKLKAAGTALANTERVTLSQEQYKSNTEVSLKQHKAGLFIFAWYTCTTLNKDYAKRIDIVMADITIYFLILTKPSLDPKPFT